MKQTVDFLWSLLKWVLLAAVLGAVAGGVYWYQRVDEEIRLRVEAAVARQYPGLSVRVRAARLLEGEGIEIRDLVVWEPGTTDAREAMLHVEEVFLSCRGDLEELLTGGPVVRRVLLRRPTIRVRPRPDGSWNVALLRPRSSSTTAPAIPEVTIENGVVEISEAPIAGGSAPSAGTFAFREVNVSIGPVRTELGQPGPNGRPKAYRQREITGHCQGDFLRQVVFRGNVDVDRGSWSLTSEIDSVELSPEQRDALPMAWREKLSPLRGLRAQAKNVVLRAVSEGPGLTMPVCEVSGQIVQGHLDDPRLPQPLSNVRGDFLAKGSGVWFKNASATMGRASLAGSIEMLGTGSRRTIHVTGGVWHLELTKDLVDAIVRAGGPTSLEDRWHALLPSGLIDIPELDLLHDGVLWHPTIKAQCRDVAFTHRSFPYRVEHVVGPVTMNAATLEGDVIGKAGERPVRIIGKWSNPLGTPAGWVTVHTKGLPLDEKFFRAVGDVYPTTEKFLRSFHPGGTIDVFTRVGRDSAESPYQRTARVWLNQCWIRFDGFRYALTQLSGTMDLRDDAWTFNDLSAVNGTALVTGHGSLGSSAQGRPFHLHLDATDVPLEEELRRALPDPNNRRLWTELALKGKVNLVTDIRRESREDPVRVALRVVPKDETVSIEPIWLPYRCEKIDGAMDYADGEITFERLSAEHDQTRLVANPTCRLQPGGQWQVLLNDLAIDRFEVTRDVVETLPERFRAALVSADPRGPVNIRGSAKISRRSAEAPITAAWDLRLGLHGVGLKAGLELENAHGGVQLVGRLNREGFGCRGELALDSITCRNVQLTEVTGPFWIDSQRILLGSWVDRPETTQGRSSPSPNRQPRPVTAAVFGGTLRGDGWVAMGDTPRYAVSANLHEAELSRYAQDVMPGKQDLAGKLRAKVALQGQGPGLHGLGGNGDIQLREADVYELPVMVAMLKLLTRHEPDRTAFRSGDINFQIDGGHIYLNRIDLVGDAISLAGKGEMDFDTNVMLNFHAILGRSDRRLPVLRDLLGEAGDQTMRIRVTGTLHDPITEKALFPVVNQALQQLQADLRGGAGIGIQPMNREQEARAAPRPTPLQQDNLFRANR